jgi:hypothetical protein
MAVDVQGDDERVLYTGQRAGESTSLIFVFECRLSV